MHKYSKPARFILWTTVLLILVLIFIPIPRSIDRSITCTVLDQDHLDYRTEVTVTLQGTYTDYLFLTDHFQGQIYLPEHDLYQGNAPEFNIDIGTFHHVNLIYIDSDNLPHYPGSFYASEDLKSFFLWLMVPNDEKPGSSRSRYFITYPEMTFVQLYDIINK